MPWPTWGIGEYELVVLQVLAVHGLGLLDGLRVRVELTLLERGDLASGAVAMRYEPKRTSG